MGDRNHSLDSLGQRKTAQVCNPVLGHNHGGIAARGTHRPTQLGHDPTDVPSCGARGQRNDRQATAGVLGAAHEVDAATDCPHVHTVRHLGVGLPRQVHFDRGIDRNQLVDRCQHSGRMDVVHAAKLQRRVAVGESVQHAAAHQHAGNANASVDVLSRVGEHAAAGQGHHRIVRRAGVQAQVSAVRQLTQDRRRQGADSDLQGRAILDQAADMAGNRGLGRLDLSRRSAQRRTAGVNREIDVLRGQRVRTTSPRRLVVDLCDHHPRDGDRWRQVVAGQRHAVLSLRVRRGQLQHQHVDP